VNVWLKSAMLGLAILLLGGIIYENVRGAAAGSAPREFTAADLRGKNWSLAEHRGRPVLVSFFETTCGPCMMEQPYLIELTKKYADRGLGLVFISREPAEEIRQAPGWRALPVPVLANAEAVVKAYEVTSYPVTLLFGPDGAVLTGGEGFGENVIAGFEKEIKKLPAVR